MADPVSTFAWFCRPPKSDIFMPQSLRTRGRSGGAMANRDTAVGAARVVTGVRGPGRGARATTMLRNDSNFEPSAMRWRGRGGTCGVIAARLSTPRGGQYARGPEADCAQQTLAESAACEADLGRAIVKT
jgi:hypothetical protein